jgi:hypothetical protein
MVFLKIANMGQKSQDFWFVETHDCDSTADKSLELSAK